jgi:multidrug efflux pump subunit AcrB
VAGANGKLVRLGDVATVKAGTEEARSLALFDGRQAVGIDILKADGTSTTQVSEGVIGSAACAWATSSPSVPSMLGSVRHRAPAASRSVSSFTTIATWLATGLVLHRF